MSTVDLNRLRIRKKYFIPINPSELESSIMTELEACNPSFFTFKAWRLAEKHKNYWRFDFNYRYSFILVHAKPPLLAQQAIELDQQYDADIRKNYFEELSNRVGGAPDELCVFVVKTETNGCIVEVELRPTFYRKIVQQYKMPEECEIQDSYLTCERFLKTIFESGLSATMVSEDKLIIPKPTMEFLINDSYVRQITERLEKMFEEATNEILIIGWIGTFFISKFKELKQKGINIFVITGNTKDIRQDIMQKEKAKAITELIDIIGKSNISIKPEFHGRMIIVDNKALIGSADLDSYSLTGTRIEFAAYTEDPSIVLSLRNYFRKVFSPWKETPA